MGSTNSAGWPEPKATPRRPQRTIRRACGSSRRSATLAAAATPWMVSADALRERRGAMRSPGEREDYSRRLAEARAAAGEEAFAAVWAEGRQMTSAQALACALIL